MAPSRRIVKDNDDQKVKKILDFAEALADKLQSEQCDEKTRKELRSIIDLLPLSSPHATATHTDAIDRIGTELWNISTRLQRERNQTATEKAWAVSLRALAFLLIDCAQSSKRAKKENNVRVLKVALKAAERCIEGVQLDLALKVLERAAHYEATLEDETMRRGDEEEVQVHERLKIEYITLRIALSWKESRLDLSGHMYSRIESMGLISDPTAAEHLADLLYEIGADQLKRGHCDVAVQWLERAYNTMEAQGMERLSGDASELRLSVLQSLVTALRGWKTPESREKAGHVMRLLESDYGDKMVVSILKLELLSSDDDFSAQEYSNVLSRMLPSIILTDANFKTLMHHIHRLKSRDQRLACTMLDQLIEQRLFDADKPAWLEKAAVTRLWLSTELPEDEHLPRTTYACLDRLLDGAKQPFDSKATHAAQTLLWKRVETVFSQGQYDIADQWCKLAVHRLFEKAGELNKHKFSRKIIMCAIARRDFASAREAYYKMSDVGQMHPITQYLMFKLALRTDDHELAEATLTKVCNEATKDSNLLYACVMDAQEMGNKRFAVLALRRVIERYKFKASNGVHLATLVRVTIRIMIPELKEGRVEVEPQVVDDVASLLEGASTSAQEYTDPTDAARYFEETELEWFSKNSYNIALQHCGTLMPSSLVRVLMTSIRFIELLQTRAQKPQDDSLVLRRTLCEYLMLVAHLTLARGEDIIEESYQHYNTIMHRGLIFRDLVASLIASTSPLGDSAKADLIAKHYQILSFELEACLKLSKWEALEALLQQLWRYEPIRHLETLADIVIIILGSVPQHADDEHEARNYHGKILVVLQKIVQAAHKQSTSDIDKLAKWIRCLFQVALPFSEDIPLQCLTQAGHIARTLQAQAQAPFRGRNPPKLYSRTELEWLATTSFNRAVDFYVAGDDARCKLWAEKSLQLSVEVDGMGKGLHEVLMGKYGGLTWDG